MAHIAITNGEIHCYTSDYHDTPLFCLDHQCDDWEIGNLEDAKQFVKDLQKTIKELEAELATREEK
jgi:hypothetical protein